MTVTHTGHATEIVLDPAETRAWALGRAWWGGGPWPLSATAGNRLWVRFDADGDLVDLSTGGGVDVPGDELDAITSDALTCSCGSQHPAIRRRGTS